MNCISGSTLLTCLFACAACGAPASETDTGKTTSSYSVHYTITPDSSDGSVAVEMAVEQTRGQLREVSFELGRTGSSDFTADGWLEFRDDGMTWQPGRTGTGTKITLRILRELASEILDGPSDSLHTDNLPGCRSFAPPAGA